MMGIGAASQGPQSADRKIDSPTSDRGTRIAWYRSPAWIAIGFLAAIVVLLLVILISRAGGATVIRN
jgi:hypothetical protein